MEVTEEELKNLTASLQTVHDMRRQSGNLRHKLADILVIAFTAILCGLREFEEMEYLGREKEQWFKGFLELPGGIPDENTFQRVFSWVQPDELQRSLHQWVGQIPAYGEVVNIDGKTIRGSADGEAHKARHVVSAWVGANNLTLGQVKTSEKSNEITAIPELLQLVDIKAATITIDAMGCQKEIAKQIVGQGADYVLAVKENQPELHRHIKEYFEWAEQERAGKEPIDCWSGCEKDHGRIERRTVWVSADITWLPGKDEWKGLGSIVRCRGHRCIGETQTDTDRYYISSLTVDARRMGELIRGHWSIENNLHWVLDVVFGEDADRKRKNHAPENFNILRKMALTILKQHNLEQKKSFKRSMLKALMDDGFRHSLLFGT